MGFGQAVTTCFSKFFVWAGRASRSEFWWWVLFVFIGMIIASAIDALLGLSIYKVNTVDTNGGFALKVNSVGILQTVFSLIVLFPGIAVSVRRLHDTNHSGWWWWLQLLNFLCLLGTIILIFAFWIQPSDRGINSYGPPPQDQGLGAGGTGPAYPPPPQAPPQA